MELDIRFDCNGVDWQIVAQTLEKVGMAHFEPDTHRRAFEASHTVVFIYRAGQLIGFGRAISDGVYQAAVYDVAILPEFQGRGLGPRRGKQGDTPLLPEDPGLSVHIKRDV